MIRPRRGHSLAVAFLASVSEACVAPGGLPLPELTWVGEHVEIGASVELSETCAGSLSYADAYVGALRERFGSETDARAELYWVPDGAELYEGCAGSREGVLGCAIGLQSIHEDLPAEHEYVHVAWPGDSASLLEEGLATYMGDDADRDWGPWSSRSASSAFDAADEAGELPFEYYGTAANFVAYLVGRFGIEPVLDLIGDAKFDSTSDEIDARMRDRLGISLQDALIDQLAEGAECNPFHARDATISCDLASRDVIPCDEIGDDWALARGVRMQARFPCGEEGVIGPKLGEVWQSYVFEVPVAGEYTVSVAAVGTAPSSSETTSLGTISIEACSAGCGRFIAPIELAAEWSTAFDLAPGRYRVRLARRVDAPIEVQAIDIEIRATTEDTFAALCSSNSSNG